MSRRKVTRRQFVADTGKLALGAMIVPRRVLGGVGFQAPSDTLNVAIVGAGGMGMENAQALGAENIVAVCDVDFGYVEGGLKGREKDRDGKPRPEGIRLQEQFAKATRYADWRVMLEKQKDLQAVLIATPDHNHAVIAKAAMESGKHVYVQKPLTWSVHEARVLRETAKRTGVKTQMGNQGHSSEGARQINEWIAAGLIGPGRQVHGWTHPPSWPPGGSRPSPPARTGGKPGGGPPPPGTGGPSPTRPASRCGAITRLRRGSTGTCTSARSRRTFPTTRSTTRSTGAAGSTSVSVPWATWARI